jgi:ArsR family transcriptional regulator
MASETEIFKALADSTRLRVLNLFLATKGSLCVCEIVDALKIPQYSVSKQLTLLKNAGIVQVEKKGLWGYYRLLTDESTNRVLFNFLKDYLHDETFKNDSRNLEARLLLREDGKCVIGLVPEQELLKRIKEKSDVLP